MTEISPPELALLHTNLTWRCNTQVCRHNGQEIDTFVTSKMDGMAKCFYKILGTDAYGEPTSYGKVVRCTNTMLARRNEPILLFRTCDTHGHDHVAVFYKGIESVVYCCITTCLDGLIVLRLIDLSEPTHTSQLYPPSPSSSSSSPTTQRSAPQTPPTNEPISSANKDSLAPMWTATCIKCHRVPNDWAFCSKSRCLSRCVDCERRYGHEVCAICKTKHK